jgi:putative membrane protein
MSEIDARCAKVLAHLGRPQAKLLGRGGEGIVFAYDERYAIKVYGDTSHEYLERLADLQREIAQCHFPFATPLIDEIGMVEDILYTCERLLPGARLEPRFPSLDPDARRQALANFFGVLSTLNSVTLDHASYGQVMQGDDFVHASTWPDFMHQMFRMAVARALPDLQEDVGDVERKTERLGTLISRRRATVPKRLVHGDYFLGNVLFNEDLTVASVLDFSPHTLVGDPYLDVAGAISFLTVVPGLTAEHVDYLTSLAIAEYGQDIDSIIAMYTLYYNFYFSDTKQSDPATYAWCINHLRDDRLWEQAMSE